MFWAIIFILFFSIYCYIENGIIKLPLYSEEEYHSSKYDFIYKLSHSFNNDIGFFGTSYYKIYTFKNMKNLSLFDIEKISDKNKQFDYEIYGEKKDEIHLSFEYRGNDPSVELDSYFKIICELFYQIKYINTKILSIGTNLEDRNYRYLGGTPEHLIKNLEKYTFNLNDTLSEIELIFENKNNYNEYYIKPNVTMNNKVEITDNSHLICFSDDIFSKFQKILFQYYKESEYKLEDKYPYYSIYNLNEKQKTSFPEIKFKIGNKSFSFKKDDLIFEDSYIHKRGNTIEKKNNFYLLIKNTPCENNILGLKFLEKFQVREYNIETNELNLYLDKNNRFLRIENSPKITFNSYDNSIAFIILSFLVLIIITIHLKINMQNNKYYEYINNCEEI